MDHQDIVLRDTDTGTIGGITVLIEIAGTGTERETEVPEKETGTTTERGAGAERERQSTGSIMRTEIDTGREIERGTGKNCFNDPLFSFFTCS